MKKIFLSLALSIAAIAAVWAQAPEKFNYQGIARDGQGAPLASQSISLRLTILDGGPSGTNVYEETQALTTNTYGLYNAAIGGGTIVSGTMAGIDWSTGNKYIKVELDPTGGASYTTIGTPQLLSVPYALYAAAAPAINGTNGGVYYGTGLATPAAFTAAGTAGQVLTSNGVAAPTWTSLSPASDVNGSPSHLIKFGTATTGVNSSLIDSSAGLMYNTNVYLSTNGLFGASGLEMGEYNAQAPYSGQGDNFFMVKGNSIGYTYITATDSTQNSKGFVVGQASTLANGFLLDDSDAFVYYYPGDNSLNIGSAYNTSISIDQSTTDVTIPGMLAKGGGTFKIDDPIDPANKYLYHSFVESPDMMNIYNGNVTTDANGVAVVTLPDYFDALNKDFRYQLTVIGTFAQAIVGEKVSNNHFTIKTNQPNVEVSWQVTGVRNDKFAQAHRVVPEVEKEARNKGKYMHPKEYGKPAADGIYTNPSVSPINKKK